MLTTGVPAVNGAPLPGVMMRVGEIAARDGISAPAVSKKVKRLIADHGLMVQADATGRVIAVNVAHYDRLLNQYADPAKAQAPVTKPLGTLDDARVRAAYYSGELDRLKLEQQIGKQLLREDVEFAVGNAADAIAQVVDAVAGTTDELAAAYEQGGQQALRIKLREIVHQTRERIADVLGELVASAPETTAAASTGPEIG